MGDARVTGVDVPPVPNLQVRSSPDRGKLLFRERCVRYLGGFGSGITYGVHSMGIKNLVRGIVERVLYVRNGERLSQPPRPKTGVFQRLASIRSRLLRKVPCTPIVALDEYPELYVGRKRRVYQAAVDSLKLRGLTVRDAIVSAFVKAEKVNFSAKVDPCPRVIQPRSSRYIAELGCYLKKFEKALFAGFQRVWGYPVVLKGMNAQEVGGWLAKHWGCFRRPVGVGLDASRFDQHVSADALRWEHSVYVSAFGGDKRLKELLSWQINNRGVGRAEGQRVDYSVHGCRMSGDINTGMGNCLIMSSIVIAYCEQAGIEFRLANNGDDCVLFVDQSDLYKLDKLEAWFLDFGFSLTREAPVFELEHVEFCQTQPVLCGNGWRMVRNPFTAMSKDCVSLQSWDTELAMRYWLTSIGKCGLALTAGVPVWSAWYARLLRMGGEFATGVDERVHECGMSYMARGVEACDITEESRYSFFKAYGILPDVQVALEAEYNEPILMDYSPTPVGNTHPNAIDKENTLTLLKCPKRA